MANRYRKADGNGLTSSPLSPPQRGEDLKVHELFLHVLWEPARIFWASEVPRGHVFEVESGLESASIRKKRKLRFLCNDGILGTGAFRRNIKSVRHKTSSGDLARTNKFSGLTDTEKLLSTFMFCFFSSFQLSSE